MTDRPHRARAAADRLATLLDDILYATGEIRTIFVKEQPFIASLENVDMRTAVGLIDMIASNLATALPARDEEIAGALEKVGALWEEIAISNGPASDEFYNELERIACPYALMFFEEIRRLERVLRRGGVVSRISAV